MTINNNTQISCGLTPSTEETPRLNRPPLAPAQLDDESSSSVFDHEEIVKALDEAVNEDYETASTPNTINEVDKNNADYKTSDTIIGSTTWAQQNDDGTYSVYSQGSMAGSEPVLECVVDESELASMGFVKST